MFIFFDIEKKNSTSSVLLIIVCIDVRPTRVSLGSILSFYQNERIFAPLNEFLLVSKVFFVTKMCGLLLILFIYIFFVLFVLHMKSKLIVLNVRPPLCRYDHRSNQEPCGRVTV